MNTSVRSALLIASIAATFVAFGPHAVAMADDGMELAIEAYENGDYPKALRLLRAPARQGEPVSLRMYCALRRQSVSNVPPAARCLSRAGTNGGRDGLPLAPAATARSGSD